MRNLYFFGAASMLPGVLVACSPAATVPATTTAADVPGLSSVDGAGARADTPVAGRADGPSSAPAAREASPAEEAATAATAAAPPDPPGQLACRTKSVVDGMTEVFLEWSGSSATGTLRREAPSGMEYVQRVRADRVNGVILVDEPSNEDLVTHAAVIGKQNGKTFMRIGAPGQPWTACEEK